MKRNNFIKEDKIGFLIFHIFVIAFSSYILMDAKGE